MCHGKTAEDIYQKNRVPLYGQLLWIMRRSAKRKLAVKSKKTTNIVVEIRTQYLV